MPQRNRHDHLSWAGATLNRVRLNEAVTHVAFAAAAARCTPASRPSAAPAPENRVLDIGCGGGYLARLLAAAVAPGGQVAGVDTSAPAISYARRRRCELLVRGGDGPEAPDESTAAHSTRHFLVGTATLLPGVRRFRASRALLVISSSC